MKNGNFTVNTIIGPHSSFKGNLVAGGFTRVDGQLEGDLNVKGRLVVGPGARMESGVRGTVIIVGGVISGDVVASESVTVLKSAVILGDIITRRIRADDGCVIHGRVKVCKTDAEWNSALRRLALKAEKDA